MLGLNWSIARSIGLYLEVTLSSSRHGHGVLHIFFIESPGRGGGGGGGSLPLEAVPDARESPSETTLNEDLMVD